MKTFAADQNEARTFGFWTDGKGNVFRDAACTEPAFLPELGGAGQQIVLGPPQLDYPWQIQNIFSTWNSPKQKTNIITENVFITEKFEISKRNVSPVQKTKLSGEQLESGETGGLSQLQFYPTILRERQQIIYTVGMSIVGHGWEINGPHQILEGQFSINYSIQQL